MDTKKEKEIEKHIIKSPLGDDDIKYFLPDAKIMKYSELSNFNHIDEVLPNNKSYVILLYEAEKNKGHWTAIMKYCNKGRTIIEYFDSLASGKPDAPLKWNSKKKNNLLGQGRKILSELLEKSGLPIIYNTVKFQSDGNNRDGHIINTCGRHIILRLITMLGNNYNLDKYIKFMDKLKKDSGNTYDEIVSHLIQDVIRI